MKNIAFVPVRKGSKSIIDKNIKLFCGKPLVYWVLNSLQKCKEIDEIILATDGDKIIEIVNSFNFKKVMIYKRSTKNSSDRASTESVILEYLENSNHNKNDNFILVQATTPFTSDIHLSEALSLFNTDIYDSILSVTKSKRFYWSDNGLPFNYDYLNRPRRQDFSGINLENGAFYISKISSIIKYRNRISQKIGFYIMPEYSSVEIDEIDDWIIAESLMRKYILKKKKSKKIKLFVTDVDGVLTDAGMYYSENGDELKKFNTHDGMAFQILRNKGIITAIVTSENTKIVKRRAEKLKVDYLFQNLKNKEKLQAVLEICFRENICISEVSYIGDDINCFEILNEVGYPACPSNSVEKIKSINNIRHLMKSGGQGVAREFVELLEKLSII